MAKQPTKKTNKTVDEDTMKSLYAEFPEEVLKEREGPWDKQNNRRIMFKYVPFAQVVDRLNEVFGLHWSVMEIESVIAGTTLLKRVRIEITDPEDNKVYCREQWGGHPLVDPNGRERNYDDCAKSAFSKAFVKAASLFGVGLYLWGVEPDDEGAETPVNTVSPQTIMQQASPPITVVNPGMHNNIPQGANVINTGPPVMTNPVPSVPPVPVGPPPQQLQQQYAPSAPFPQLNNPNAVNMPQAQGQTSGPNTTAQAQITFPTQERKPIEDHQAQAIKGMAMPYQIDPLQAVNEALGAESQGIRTVEMLDFDQAQRVLAYMRHRYPYTFNTGGAAQ